MQHIFSRARLLTAVRASTALTPATARVQEESLTPPRAPHRTSTARRSSCPSLPASASTEPVLTSSGPVLTSTEPVLTSSVAVCTSMEPVLTSMEPVLTSSGPVLTSTEPVLTSSAVVLTSLGGFGVHRSPLQFGGSRYYGPRHQSVSASAAGGLGGPISYRFSSSRGF